MNDQPGHPTKPRTTAIALWVAGAVAVLIAAVTLWVGWPKSAPTVPTGESRAEIYLIDDSPELTTPAPAGAKSGWFGRISLPCSITDWYVESEGTAMCASVGGPYGTVTVIGRDGRFEVPADAQKALAAAAAEWPGSSRALLVQDGDPFAIVTLATPSTAVLAG